MSSNDITTRFRLLGFFPLIFFIAHLLNFLSLGEVGHILWMCHISNLTLALGLFLCQRTLIRVSVLWLVYGLPLWLWNVAELGVETITTFGTHFGGLVVGLSAVAVLLFARVRIRFARDLERVRIEDHDDPSVGDGIGDPVRGAGLPA